jgi:Holliday junction resolvasome RuvABC endonuclease subunit
MRFLGIDQSLNATGLCRITEDGVVDATATIDPEKRKDGERLLFVKRAAFGVTLGVRFAAIEGYAYDAVGRVFELGEIGGTLKVMLLEVDIQYVIVAPILVKKFATGSTSASKEAMISAAAERGFAAQDDNQADAFFLAHIARAYADNTAKRRCELEVIEALRHPAPKKSGRRVRRLIKAAI